MIQLLKSAEGPCACGKCHVLEAKIYSGKGVLSDLAKHLSILGAKRAYIIADENTYGAAGARTEEVLRANGFSYDLYKFERSPFPNEKFIDAAIENKPPLCDALVAIGSGVINDIGKLVAKHYSIPYVIVATAPSMDGYASKTSSVAIKGLKTSLPSKCADIIIGDADVLKTAPKRMLASGIGDMIAKYVSICEWRIANLLWGEYYCEKIAGLVRYALKKCTENVDELMSGDEGAILDVFNALTVGSVAMNYAGISRPASGCEHYVSHIMDMRNEEFGTPADLHGIQCGIATYLCRDLYDKLCKMTPDREKALAAAEKFSYEDRKRELKKLLGKGADAMIELEAREGKFDKEKHAIRLDTLISKFEDVKRIVAEEMPSREYLDELFSKLGLQKDYAYLGLTATDTANAFEYSGDTRDKYVLSRILWDLGIMDEFTDYIKAGETL